MNEETTELGMVVDTIPPPPNPWQGGQHDGSRLSLTEQTLIRDLFMEGASISEIRVKTGHSRNTISKLLATPQMAAQLRELRAARLLLEEEALMRERADVIETLADKGKLKLSDLNSALMITGIGIKDAGGAAPQRLEVKVEHGLSAAAELMASSGRRTAPFMPTPVQEAELVPVRSQDNTDADGAPTQANEA